MIGDAATGETTAAEPVTVVGLADVVAEVSEAFERYEAALVANDLDALAEAFWDSELTVRFGVADRQYGAEAIDAWRQIAPPLPPGRVIGPTTIVTFGRDAACVTTEFRYPSSTSLGRQSQTWIRFADGWRIVTAHVSLLPE